MLLVLILEITGGVIAYLGEMRLSKRRRELICIGGGWDALLVWCVLLVWSMRVVWCVSLVCGVLVVWCVLAI